MSIHQPSSTTFEAFDKLLLLASGKTCYFGSLEMMESYFTKIHYSIPPRINPAEFLLDLVTSDFAHPKKSMSQQRDAIQSAWAVSTESDALKIRVSRQLTPTEKTVATQDQDRPRVFQVTVTLLRRLFVKSYRDFVAYEIRILMYLGMCPPFTTMSEN